MTGWMKALTAALVGDRLGHREQAELIEIGDVEVRADRGVDDRARDVVGTARVGFSKCVYLNVTKLIGVEDPDASTVPILSQASLPVPAVPAVNWPNCALVEAVRAAIAAVHEHGLGRRERQLAEAFVAHAVEVRHVAVGGRRVLPRCGRAGSRSRRRTGGSVRIGPPTLRSVQARPGRIARGCRC